MSKRLLPEEGTPEADKEREFFENATPKQLEDRSQVLGYKNAESYAGSMNKRLGAHRARKYPPAVEKETEPPIINLPPIKLREYKPRKVRRGDEEEAVLQTADGHAGKVVPDYYDEDVYRESMDEIFESTMAIVTLHRHMYPINTLRIPILGDNVQGENPRQGSRVGAIKMGARDQVAKLAFPAWTKLICSLKQEFAEVIVDGWPGNHGHYSPDAPETSSWDLLLYDQLASKLNSKKGITINIHENWADVIYIMGFKFFCFHGDEVPCQQGVPFFALTKKLKSWYMEYRGFDYALCGHFHKRISDELAAGVEYFVTGTLVPRDPWALKKLGISSVPSQWLFGVHPRRGVTWRYGLTVNKRFLHNKEVQGKLETWGRLGKSV